MREHDPESATTAAATHQPTIHAATLHRVQGRLVKITTASEDHLPSLRIDGLAQAAEPETRVRVQAALANSNRPLTGNHRVTCDASGLRLDGQALDLPIALAVGAAIDGLRLPLPYGAIGELSLRGDVRPVRGALPLVEALKHVTDTVIVAPENAEEAALVPGMRVLVAATLDHALRLLDDKRARELFTYTARGMKSDSRMPPCDLSDIRGQERAVRALEIAAAGGHNLLLVGGPGSGKTMLARRLVGLLPQLTHDEALQVTRIQSAAGLNVGGGKAATRPFRAPHYSVSPAGLTGGGGSAGGGRPGELALAHQGVLFLDELNEFSRAAMESLIEPLKTGEVVLSRVSGSVHSPARCHIVASMLPCQCGYHGVHGNRCCDCSTVSIERHWARIPQALLAAFDLRVEVNTLSWDQLETAPRAEPTAVVAARVAVARSRSATMTTDRHAVQRTARTIAQLAGDDIVHDGHLDEARALVADG